MQTTYEGDPITIGPPRYDFDSIQIANKWYYGVEEITDNNSITQLNYYCLFTQKDGIIKMRLKDKQEWELIPD